MKDKEKGSILNKVFLNKRRLVILATILVAGFLVWKFTLGKKEEVETAKVERGTVAEELVLSGEIDAD